MNPNACRIALRPRSPLDVFDLSLRLLRERARPFARLSALVLTPIFVVLALLLWLSGGSFWVLLVPFFFGAFLQAPFTVLAARLLFADQVSVGEVLRGTLSRLLGLGLVALLLDFALPLSMALSILLWPVFLYSAEATLLERVPIGRAVSRSASLMSGAPMSAMLGAVLRIGLPCWGLLAGELLGQVVVDFVLQLGQPFGALATGHLTPFALAGVLLIQPLLAVFRLLLYVDARTRQEGWDLQVAIRALGLREVG